jgi:hypothetical protein
MTNLLNERRDEVSSLLCVAEQALEQLRHTFERARSDDDLLDIRAAIGQSVFPLNLAYEALIK